MKQRLALTTIVIILALIGTFAWWTNRVDVPKLPNPPLKDLAAARGVQLGNYASLKLLGQKPYDYILTSQFAFATIDGEPNWQFNDGALRPTKDSFDYTNMDKVIKFAEANNMPLQIHHLVWGEEKWLPDWLKNGNFTKDQLLEIIHNHIATVAGHYKGKVREWTVVNEAFTRGLHANGLNDWWIDHVGDQSFIDQAFIWAHETDPGAKLLMNDFYSEIKTPYSDAMHDYIKGMKERGVPIDGVGLQMHVDGSHPPKKDDMIYNMQRFADLGIGVYITELDVNMNDVKGSESDKLGTQASIYHDVARACIESKVCHSLALLGITDKDSWYNEMGVPHAIPLIFDSKYRPKPAFFGLRGALQEN